MTYKVEHYFPAIKERGGVLVETLEEAEVFFKVKCSGRSIYSKEVRMYDPEGKLLKYYESGLGSAK